MIASRLRSRALSAAVLFGTVLVAGASQASGYSTARFGADHGTPAQANPFAIYFNPGAIGETQGTVIVGDAGLIYRHATYERTPEALSPSNPQLANDANYRAANTGKATLNNVLALPYLGITSDLGTKSLRVGYAFYVPFGGSASWSKASQWQGNAAAPGAYDGPQRWHNINGSITALFNTVAVAWNIAPARLSIGANFSLVSQSASTVRARNADGTDDTRGLNGGLKEGRSLLDVSGTTFAFAFGLLWDPIEDGSLKIGASYTTQPGLGETKMHGTLTTQLGTDKAVSPGTDVDLFQSWPDVFRVGLTYRTSPKSELRLDSEYVRWSVFKRQCVVVAGSACNLGTAPNGLQGFDPAGKVVLNVPRNWIDTIGLRLGGAWFPTDRAEVFGSVSVSTSAVPIETIDASTIDSNQYFVTLGGRYAVTRKLFIAASYTQIFFSTVDTLGRSQLGTYAATSRSPSADGVYQSWVGLLDVNATYAF